MPEQYNASEDPKWEQPIPFEEIVLPDFPIEALPARVRPYVEAVAETTQTPVDMAGTAAIAAMASCIQGKYLVKAKTDWIEPTNLYALMVAEPSERKSAVTSLIVKPINLYLLFPYVPLQPKLKWALVLIKNFLSSLALVCRGSKIFLECPENMLHVPPT